ncbi:MAG: hypothetical protein AB1646_12685 [Thermodesulfobacteriota bacterium]
MQPKTISTAFALAISLAGPARAWAFQSHPAPEGLYVHQLAHVCFIAAMGILAYWLERNRLTEQRGWRFIQVSCVLFIAWNVFAFTGHWVEERVPDSSLIGEPDWTARLVIDGSPVVFAYYLLKLDHLVCVPAVVCLFLGIRALFVEANTREREPHE